MHHIIQIGKIEIYEHLVLRIIRLVELLSGDVWLFLFFCRGVLHCLVMYAIISMGSFPFSKLHACCLLCMPKCMNCCPFSCLETRPDNSRKSCRGIFIYQDTHCRKTILTTITLKALSFKG